MSLLSKSKLILVFFTKILINYFFRCPPTAPAPGQNCYTLPDASDPCCNITVCDDPVLDPDENVDKAEQKQPRIINDGGGIGK